MNKLIFFSLIVGLSNCKETCFDNFGCFKEEFSLNDVLKNSIALLPESPTIINVKFYLYNRNTSKETLSPTNISLNFNPTLKTKVIIHGFLHSPKKKWIVKMKDALLEVENQNVIIVDWSNGHGYSYLQAIANTKIIGAEIAMLLNSIINEKSIDAKSLHLIGHSLGAHIAGQAGAKINNLGKITGLDPAGPYYENADSSNRLDKSDALYVEAIHTDVNNELFNINLGIKQPIGHVDFYPNGGSSQPNCRGSSGKLFKNMLNLKDITLENIENHAGCNHMSAVFFYTESILNHKCKFTSYPCNSKQDFDNGKCLKCSQAGCNSMGYSSSPLRDNGTLYLITQSSFNNLCKQNYLITLYSHDLSLLKKTKGKFTISFKTSKETSSSSSIDDENVVFQPDLITTKLISLNEPLSFSIESAFVSFTKTNNFFDSWFYDSGWSFRNISIFNGETQSQLWLCPLELIIESGQTVEFIPC